MKLKTIIFAVSLSLITLFITSCSQLTQTNEEDTLTILPLGGAKVTRSSSFPSSSIDAATNSKILNQLKTTFPSDFTVTSTTDRGTTKYIVTSPFFGDVNSAIVELANARGETKKLVNSGTWVRNNGLFSYDYTLNITTSSFITFTQASLTVVMPWEIAEAPNAIVSPDRHSATWNLGGTAFSQKLILKTKPIMFYSSAAGVISILIVLLIVLLILILSRRKRNKILVNTGAKYPSDTAVEQAQASVSVADTKLEAEVEELRKYKEDVKRQRKLENEAEKLRKYKADIERQKQEKAEKARQLDETELGQHHKKEPKQSIWTKKLW